MSTVAVDWPDEPYKGLVWYGPEDRLLFSGRDGAVKTCMHFIAASETRILLLHGQTGCGKSSFLRAALIPDLEERAHGYLFMRDDKGAPLFIRSGADPLARIAEQVFRFASDAVSLPGIEGEKYDLSAARLGKSTVAEFIEECRKPGMMTRSLRALCEIPKTLVIILDQAEEVLTFSDSNPEHRRQFFRFVREFATSNFPVKFIIALRKDYSGEFLGLAQLGGAIDLRTNPVDMSPPSTDGTTVDRIVKSDIKIYLLPELRRDEVQHAIELPTSKEKVYEDKQPPFDKYRFTYAPGVAKRIVDDLFTATSATAVLPVMQIVCRDLYHAAKSGKKTPSQIDEKLYKHGGGVSGPVDRHITDSLKKSFGKLPAGIDIATEEQRWRELLYRLVRRESDGTVHTNIVDEAQLKAMADEIGVTAKLADVTAYLTRSDVLLLRSVTALIGTEGRESRLFSLGHDAIGLVLHDWKMRALASERLVAEEKASKRRIRNATFAGIAAVLAVAGVAIAMVVAVAKGRADQKHDVLLRIASANGRSAPMGAAFAAAHATVVAKDMHRYEIWKQRDTRADELLANILAGLPKKTTFAAAAARDTDASTGGIPLPMAVGFANVDGSKVEMVTGVHGGDGQRTSFVVDKPADSTTTTWTGGEAAEGAVVLLQNTLPSAALDPGAGVERVYVLTKDRQAQPINPLTIDYFRNKANTPTLKPIPPGPKKKTPRGDVPADEFLSLELSGSIVVLSKVKASKDPTKGEMYIASFVYDPKAPADDPFKLGMEAEFHIDLEAVDSIGFNEPLMLDGYMIVPVKLDPSQSGASPDMWAVRYDLRTGSRRPVKGFDALMGCKNDKCGWELIRRDASDNLIVFGKRNAMTTARPGTRSFQQAAEPDVDQFERFIVFDAAADESVPVNARTLRDVRRACASRMAAGEPDAARKSPTSRMFVAGERNRLLFGLQTGRSVDLLEVRNNGSATTCAGILLDTGDVSVWRTARNGKTLLAASNNVGLSWNVDENTQAIAASLTKQDLVAVACARGLRGHESPNDELTAVTTTYLGEQVTKLCGDEANQVTDNKERPAAQFPGVDVTTKDVPGALKK